MRIFEDVVPEKLLLEKFFSQEDTFEIKKWKQEKGKIYNRIQTSIAKNLDNIFNSINRLTIDDYLEKKLTFLDFGVPDFMTSYQSGSLDLKTCSQCVEKAIKSFEPRLVNVKVEVKTVGASQFIEVQANIKQIQDSFFEIMFQHVK